MTSNRQASAQPSVHWLSVWQFIFSLIAAIALWSMAGMAVIIGAAPLLNVSPFPGNTDSFFMLAAGMAFSGVLLLPSAYYAFRRLVGRAEDGLRSRVVPWYLRPTFLVAMFPSVLLLGGAVQKNALHPWLLLPPLHILATGLPLLWLVYLSNRGIAAGSPQRQWGVLGSGLLFSPLIVLVVEIAVLMLILGTASLYLTTQPKLADEISALAKRLSQEPPLAEEALQLLEPYLLHPGVVYIVLVFGAVIVPLVEELLKPIGLWLLSGHSLTPGAGFAAGVISGAGFALFESLMFGGNLEDWQLVVVARIGAGLMHVLTTGLVGWALVRAWRLGDYFRLAVAYLTAVLIHGLWNGLTLLSIGYQIIPEIRTPPSFVSHLAWEAPLGLGVLTVLMFFLLLLSNRGLRKAEGRL